ncbi:hypothetical protein GCM10022297_12870 [Lactobacillus hamsteri]|uniref:Uncharacterized protein n=1 Tax=Lactobacillus hamsteri DSM 5661 = JCM 6256 TaxID=1423754 RepID=A0A0R1YE17_9LACO|nr:hypothetical protein FC39_GL000409 [Lactobacillus hamsteri DSM 5661 = JCM 6256]
MILENLNKKVLELKAYYFPPIEILSFFAQKFEQNPKKIKNAQKFEHFYIK